MHDLLSLLALSLFLSVSTAALSLFWTVLSLLSALTRGHHFGFEGCPVWPHTEQVQSAKRFGASRIVSSSLPLSLIVVLSLEPFWVNDVPCGLSVMVMWPYDLCWFAGSDNCRHR